MLGFGEAALSICDRCKRPLARSAAICPECGERQSAVRPARIVLYCVLVLLACSAFAAVLILVCRSDPYQSLFRIL